MGWYDEFVQDSWSGGYKTKPPLIDSDERDLFIAVLGLVGESGEVAEKVKKILRGDDINRSEIIRELGDVVFYVSWLAHWAGASLDDVLVANVEKLTSRIKSTGTLQGQGDNR